MKPGDRVRVTDRRPLVPNPTFPALVDGVNGYVVRPGLVNLDGIGPFAISNDIHDRTYIYGVTVETLA